MKPMMVWPFGTTVSAAWVCAGPRRVIWSRSVVVRQCVFSIHRVDQTAYARHAETSNRPGRYADPGEDHGDFEDVGECRSSVGEWP